MLYHCYTTEDDIRSHYGWLFPNVLIYRSGPNYKNNGLWNNWEPSVVLLIQKINKSWHKHTGVKRCIKFTNKKATYFNVGCVWSRKVFSTEHKWIDHDAEIALTQLSFKAIYGDTKKNTTEEAGLTITILLFSPGDKLYKSVIFCTVKGLASERAKRKRERATRGLPPAWLHMPKDTRMVRKPFPSSDEDLAVS